MFSSIIISGALAQDHEFIYPYYRLLEENSRLDVCLIGGKPVQGILGTTLPPNKNHPVKDIDKVIACICSAVQLLISAKIVKGKKIAGYYSLEDDIINAGAIYTDKPAVVDGKIVTTAHYKDMGPWMKAALSFFNEKQK